MTAVIPLSIAIFTYDSTRPLSQVPLQLRHDREPCIQTQSTSMSDMHFISIGYTALCELFRQYRSGHCQLASQTVRLDREYVVL
jgi:hypothetical protein